MKKTDMQRKEDIYKLAFNRKEALFSSIGLSLLFNSVLIICMIYMSFRITSVTHFNWWEALRYFIILFICNAVLTYLLFLINYRIIKKNKKRRKTVFLIALGTMVTCGMFSPLLSQIQSLFIDGLDVDNGFEGFVAFNLVKDALLAVLVIFVIGIRYSNYYRERTLIINQKLIEENIRTRYEALKNQLDPHFLFNSLNTLNGLIGMDNDKAHDYVDNLSSIFRYTLHSKSICKLSEEIEFANSYIHLLKIRYGENLVVRYDIEEKYRNWYLMPVSIQLLVENAIKHNIISNKKPLFILIRTTDRDSIVVENIINPKLQEGLSGGVGLSNLADRYSILFHKPINISRNDGVFMVGIPLLKEMKSL